MAMVAMEVRPLGDHLPLQHLLVMAQPPPPHAQQCMSSSAQLSTRSNAALSMTACAV
jgi:hypothetical protein